MPIDFSSTNTVVTGASSGIGRAMAIAFAKSGTAKVLVHYCKNQAGAEETAELVRKSGADAFVCRADLSHSAEVDGFAQTAFDELGVVHSWVNNAGVDVLTGESQDLDFDSKLRMLFEVDVLGTIRLARNVSDRMARQPTDAASSMLFIGWDQAPLGMEGDAGQMFGPVKSAVMAFAASLAQSVAPHVRVNTIAPGWIQTKWGESTSEYWDRRAKGQSLMNRWGQPEDIARAALYACDPANSFLTGQVIRINGGWNRNWS